MMFTAASALIAAKMMRDLKAMGFRFKKRAG